MASNDWVSMIFVVMLTLVINFGLRLSLAKFKYRKLKEKLRKL